MSGSIESLVAMVLEILDDLSGTLGGSVRRELRYSDFIRLI